MSKRAAQAGDALIWRSVQILGVKVIDLLRLAILARLLAPDSFGLLAVALIPVELLLNASNLGMIPALVQRERIEESHYDTAWTVGLARALAVSALALLAAPLIGWLADEPRAVDLVRVLALGPIVEAAASIRVADRFRALDFRSLAMLDLAKGVANTVAAAALALHVGVWALVIGRLVGAAVYLLASYAVAPHAPRLRVERRAAGDLMRFGRWILASSLLAVAAAAILRLVVSRNLGVAELGLYYMAGRVAFLPGEVASQVVGAVIFPVYARLQHDRDRTRAVFRQALTALCALLAPACLVLVALAPSVATEILGAQWTGAAPLIRVLAVAALLGLVGEAVVPLFIGLGQPRKATILEAVQSLLLMCVLWPLIESQGVLGAALAWLPAVALSQLMAIVLVRQALPESMSALAGRLSAIVLVAAAGAGAAAWVDAQLGGLAGLVLAAAGGGVVSLAGLWWLERRLDLELGALLGELFPALRLRADRLRRG